MPQGCTGIPYFRGGLSQGLEGGPTGQQGLGGSLKCSHFVLRPGCGAAFQKPRNLSHLEHAKKAGDVPRTPGKCSTWNTHGREAHSWKRQAARLTLAQRARSRARTAGSRRDPTARPQDAVAEYGARCGPEAVGEQAVPTNREVYQGDVLSRAGCATWEQRRRARPASPSG